VARPDGPLIWIHAASIGETGAVAALIQRLRGIGIEVVLTTGTVTSANFARERLGRTCCTNMSRSTSSPRSAASSITGGRISPSSPNPKSGR
jgi:hypothetical protein